MRFESCRIASTVFEFAVQVDATIESCLGWKLCYSKYSLNSRAPGVSLNSSSTGSMGGASKDPVLDAK